MGANVLADGPGAGTGEVIQTLVSGPAVRIERIVSTGQTTPDGIWYDQPEAEWVTLLTGAARIAIAGQTGEIAMSPGDTLLLPARCRHRVTWTDPDQRSIWLAVFMAAGETPDRF